MISESAVSIHGIAVWAHPFRRGRQPQKSMSIVCPSVDSGIMVQQMWRKGSPGT
jgi:hypothetical protein